MKSWVGILVRNSDQEIGKGTLRASKKFRADALSESFQQMEAHKYASGVMMSERRIIKRG